MLEQADGGDGVEALLGDVAVVHEADFGQVLEALFLNLGLAPLGLFLGQGHAEGLHAALGGVAHHAAPAAADIQVAVALLETKLVEDEAVLVLLGLLQRGVGGGVVGAGVGHGVSEEELVEVVAHVVVVRDDFRIALLGVLGQALVQLAAQPGGALDLGHRLDLERAHRGERARHAGHGLDVRLGELVIHDVQCVEDAVGVCRVLAFHGDAVGDVGAGEAHVAGPGGNVGQALQTVDLDGELRVDRPGCGTIEGLPAEGIRAGDEGVNNLGHGHRCETSAHKTTYFFRYVVRRV